MFGIIISSRPVYTSAQQITPTQFAFSLPSLPHFSHIVVFLLPGTTLPPDMAAAVYIQLPGSTEFKLLGAIANEKQSAIFKVNEKAIGIVGMGGGAADEDAMVDDMGAGGGMENGAGGNVTLGISVEPAVQVAAQVEQLKASSSAPAPTGTELVRRNAVVGPTGGPTPVKVLAQRIIKNAFDYLASFAMKGPQGEVVPLKSFQDWWTKFEKRIENDPGFLERGEQG